MVGRFPRRAGQRRGKPHGHRDLIQGAQSHDRRDQRPHLNKALDILKAETTKLLIEQRNVSAAEAEKIMLQMWDCPIAEVVDIVKGTYCMNPKNLSAKPPQPLPAVETAQEYVTVGNSPDLNTAMDTASIGMINLLVEKLKLNRLDAYGLASVAMDCRIAAPTSAEKIVHCLLSKSLWTDKRG